MKNKTLIIIIIAFVLLSLPMFTLYINNIQIIRHNQQYENIIYEKAIQFVIYETDAQQKYGDNLEALVTETKMDFVTTSRQKFESYGHFVSDLNKATIYVTINKKYCCVVVLTKDDQGNLNVSNWYWYEAKYN